MPTNTRLDLFKHTSHIITKEGVGLEAVCSNISVSVFVGVENRSLLNVYLAKNSFRFSPCYPSIDSDYCVFFIKLLIYTLDTRLAFIQW